MPSIEQDIETFVVELCGDSGNRKIEKYSVIGNRVVEGTFSKPEELNTFRMYIVVRDGEVNAVFATVEYGIIERTYGRNGNKWDRL